jgi:hypothetical protein
MYALLSTGTSLQLLPSLVGNSGLCTAWPSAYLLSLSLCVRACACVCVVNVMCRVCTWCVVCYVVLFMGSVMCEVHISAAYICRQVPLLLRSSFYFSLRFLFYFFLLVSFFCLYFPLHLSVCLSVALCLPLPSPPLPSHPLFLRLMRQAFRHPFMHLPVCILYPWM